MSYSSFFSLFSKFSGRSLENGPKGPDKDSLDINTCRNLWAELHLDKKKGKFEEDKENIFREFSSDADYLKRMPSKVFQIGDTD